MAVVNKKVSLVGAGNLATHLAHALLGCGYEIEMVFSRTKKSASTLAKKLGTPYCTDLAALPSSSNFYIICVKDDAISDIVRNLISYKNSVVLHTSGTIDKEILSKFHFNGVLYPLQTFSKKKSHIDFSRVPFLIEASDTKTLKTIKTMAKKLSDKVIETSSEDRQKVHLAAVFACNFSNLLYNISDTILKEINQDIQLLLPLIEETVNKIKTNSPKDVQTGPAIRGDKKTIGKHLKLLKNQKDYRKIYKILTEEITKEL
jgi:predicted short-subunit dehydrogenase-like oxidoreductase (DUF2520 family)